MTDCKFKMRTSVFIAILLISLVFYSCERPPELPNTPKINFRNIEFIDNLNSSTDTLKLTIDFEDGNGDLGLGGDENFPPYHLFDPIYDDSSTLIYYREREFNPSLPPYSTEDWLLLRDEDNRIEDTILVEYNPNRFNIFVDLYRKINGEYFIVDWSEEFENSPGLNSRFPILFDEDSQDRALVGTMEYDMQSRAWLSVFTLDSLQIRAFIKDRALNSSNTVVSPDFTLTGIKREAR